MKILKQPEKKTYERDAQLTKTVVDIIDNVRTNGDQALVEYAAKFDKMDIQTVRVDPEEVRAAYSKVDSETLEAIKFSAGQIRFRAGDRAPHGPRGALRMLRPRRPAPPAQLGADGGGYG